MKSMRVVVVDHYDSYTWNLAHLIAEVTGSLPAVVQHDEATLADLAPFTHVVLSPGPGRPDNPADFRVGRDVLLDAGRPILGVCLGMQGIVTVFGGRVERTGPVHGRSTAIEHDGRGIFRGLPQGFRGVRYHSLAAVEIPASLEVTATTPDGVVMGVRHRGRPVEGVQFHPESVLSDFGIELVRNFLESA